ncbi:MAG: hypothetical protein DRO09_02160 [Thermoprotei archaeon]|nr:MAG: hypothetical protein DRO09_02160 [Thermoprotei archaeon]
MKKPLQLAVQYLTLFFIVLTLNFVLVRMMPGSPLDYLSENPEAVTPLMNDEIRLLLLSYYGLDKPLHVQFIDYLAGILRGDLGYSIYYAQPVMVVVLPYLMRSLILVFMGFVITLAISLPLGVVSAWKRSSKLDTFLTSTMVIMRSMPPFFVAMMFLLLFIYKLKMFPLTSYAYGESLTEILYRALLPSIVFALCEVGGIYYFVRNAVLEVIGEEFVLLARAKGLKDRILMFRHVFKAALPAISARISIFLGFSFASSMFVEYVFTYPGIMTLLTIAYDNYDYPLLHAILLILLSVIIFANMLADLVMVIADPRIRTQ